MPRLFGDPLDPSDWRNYIFPPATIGPGLLESAIKKLTGSSSYKYNGPSAMDKLRAEMDRQRQKKVQSQGAPSNGISEIIARLEALQDPTRYMSNQDALMQQARYAADAQYNPLISSLRNQRGAAETRGNRYRQEIGDMFSALSTDLTNSIPRIQEQYAQTKENTAEQYQQLQDSIKQQYAESQQSQEDLFKRLNIEAAMSETVPRQSKDQDFFTALAMKEGQTQQAALGTEERGATEFTREGSEIARLEGNSRQANLMADLQQLLSAYDERISAHEAAKEQAYMSGLLDLQGQDRKNALDMSQREFDNYIKSIQLGRDLQGDLRKGGVTVVKSPADVAGRALTMGLPTSSAQKIQNAFMSALGDEFVLGGYNSSTGTPASKEALAARILEIGRQRGMSQAELNALHTAALEYFGRA